MPNRRALLRTKPRVLILVLCLVFGTGCQSLRSFGATPTGCLPSFLDAGGWYGGDTASSIPLDDRPDAATLWLFGDSFVERTSAPGRRSYPFVHNTIGLSWCSARGDWRLETFWRGRTGDSPSAFFQPDPEAPWAVRARAESGAAPYYWPLDGFTIDGTLFVGLLRVTNAPARGPFRLPFRFLGMDLARIPNPTAPPARWRIESFALSEDPTLLPGASFVVDGDHVYAFAFLDRGDGRSPRTLTRFPIDAMTADTPDIPKRIETLDHRGRFRRALPAREAAIVMSDDATEMSVHWDAARGRWLAVYVPTRVEGHLARDVVSRSATDLAGPWTEARPLLAIPETSGTQIDPNVFCYAGKAHPHFSTEESLLLTYVCNLFARYEGEGIAILRRLADSPDLYRARAVRVSVPPVSPPASPTKH